MICCIHSFRASLFFRFLSLYWYCRAFSTLLMATCDCERRGEKKSALVPSAATASRASPSRQALLVDETYPEAVLRPPPEALGQPQYLLLPHLFPLPLPQPHALVRELGAMIQPKSQQSIEVNSEESEGGPGGGEAFRRAGVGVPMTAFALVVVLALLLGLAGEASAYHKGDTIHLARKAQFNQLRTEWHEVFGRFCPHFGVNRVVAMPLPKPKSFEKGHDYKISFALDHYNFHTSWMRVIDGKKKSISIPIIQVNMVHAGERVTGFRAKVVPLPREYSNAHSESISHFRNETHWPKHLVVKYEWEERNVVKVDLGILVITAIGVLVTAYLTTKIVSGSKEKLAHFAQEVSAGGEDPYMGGGGQSREQLLKGE